jgi:hypothetical protein
MKCLSPPIPDAVATRGAVVDKLRALEYAVEPIPVSIGREIIANNHYAGGSSNTAVFMHGLIRLEDRAIVGVAQWLPPTKNAAIATHEDWRRVLALSRLVVLTEVPANAASFLIGRSIRIIRKSKAWSCLVTYADLRMGHTGAIYRATNWEYVGETPAYTNWIDDVGNLVSRQATKSRPVAEMKALGCSKVKSSKHKFRIVL